MPLSRKHKKYIEQNYRRLSAAKIASELGVDAHEVQQYIDTLSKSLNPRRQKVFRVAALLIPILFFVMLELGLRFFNYQGDLSLFVTAPGEYSEYYRCNPDVARRYFFMQSTVPDPPNDLFLKEKPANGYRIFVMGGSTTAGYPYGNNVMFPRILKYRLQDVFPDKHIEVVNTAITAVNSYTIVDFMDEVLEMQPDAILIYAGHNEFYGALGAASNETLGRFHGFVRFYLKLQRFKTFLLVRNTLGTIRRWLGELAGSGSVSDPTATLMERLVGEQSIAYGSDIYESGKQQFRSNLQEICKKAKEHDVKLVLSELISNVRDMKPFVSIAHDTLPRADQVYARAQEMEQAGRYDEARELYVQAKDLDGLRFRAPEEFNKIVREAATEFSVPVVPMKATFEQSSPHGLVGDNLMLEHLHPNVDGYFLMADGFFDTLREYHFVSKNWYAADIKPEQYYRENWGMTDLDLAYANIRIRILKGNWPFQPKSLPNRALVDYVPKTKADSVALNIWLKKDFNLEHGHVQLAEFYEGKGDFVNAFREYKALTYLTPFNAAPYLHAAECLIKARQLNRALPFLHASLDLENSAYANKWLGQIYLDKGRTQKALSYLEEAAKMNPDDPQLIYNLSGAYALSQQYEKAKKALARLEEISPNFPGASHLKAQLDQL